MTANHQEAIPTTGYIRRCNLAKLLDTSVSTIELGAYRQITEAHEAGGEKHRI